MVALCLVIDHFWKDEVAFVESPGRNSDFGLVFVFCFCFFLCVFLGVLFCLGFSF